MTIKEKIALIDLDKIADTTARTKVKAFINKVEAEAEANPTDAMNLIEGLIGKLSLSNPQAIKTKITKAEAQKKVDKIKKMKNIVPQKADIEKIKGQIAKQYPTWDAVKVEELAKIRVQAQADRADSIKKMIENLEKTNLYAGKLSNAPIDYVPPKDPNRVMRSRNLPKDAKTSAITEADELRLPNGRKYKRKSPTYGQVGGAKRPYYYEYRMNRRDVDNKIQLAKGGKMPMPNMNTEMPDWWNQMNHVIRVAILNDINRSENTMSEWISKVKSALTARGESIPSDIIMIDAYNHAKYAKGGKAPQPKMNITFTDDFFEQGRGKSSEFYVGQTISYPITKSTKLDGAVKRYFNKFAERELVIEEIISDTPYNLAKVFDKESGEKISGHVILNPKVITKYAKGGNVSIPNAEKMMHLPMEVAVYVPSTSNVDKEISPTEMKSRVKEVETYLAETFGGFTSSEKVGGYLSERSGVITEKVVPVTAFATSESFAKNKSKLVNKLAVWAKKWGQEAMGLEFEGDLYYVPQKFKKGGRLTATYIPNDDIESITTRFGQTFKGKDVLDGAYVRRKVKTPKVTRYMFEEEEFEYGKGGSVENYTPFDTQKAGKLSGTVFTRSDKGKKTFHIVGGNKGIVKGGKYGKGSDVYNLFDLKSEYGDTISAQLFNEYVNEDYFTIVSKNKFADGGSLYAKGGKLDQTPDQVSQITIVMTDWNNEGDTHIFWAFEVWFQGGEVRRFVQEPEKFERLRKKIDRKDIQLMKWGHGGVDRNKINELIEGLDMGEITPIYTSYAREQHYGGAEEGGWYYHTMSAIEEVTSEEYEEIQNEPTDRYGEGIVARDGFIFGEDEKTDREYYR